MEVDFRGGRKTGEPREQPQLPYMPGSKQAETSYLTTAPFVLPKSFLSYLLNLFNFLHFSCFPPFHLFIIHPFIVYAGIDTGGVYRDAIGCFWQEFYNACTLGEEQRVPTLRHDFQAREWTAIARILAKGYLDLGYFPYMICQAFIMSILFGESSVTEDILLDNFKKNVAKDEKQIICEALNGNLGEDDNMNELLDLLDRFDCRKTS